MARKVRLPRQWAIQNFRSCQTCSRRILRFCKIHEFSVTSSVLRAGSNRGINCQRKIYIPISVTCSAWMGNSRDNITQSNALL